MPLGVPTQVTLAKGDIILTIIMVINAIISATKVIVRVDILVIDSKDVTHIGKGITQMRDFNMDEGITKAMVIIITGSENYGDQGYRGYQRKNPKLSNYDGKISFRAYEVKLNRMAQQYQWTEDEKLSKFVEALQDRALQFYGNLPEEVRDDYQLVSKKFHAWLWPQEPSQTMRSQLKVLKQQPDESLEEYAEKCQQLATDAWGATNPENDGTFSDGCISSWVDRHRGGIQYSGQGTSKSG